MKKKSGAFMVALLILFPAMLAAQDDSSPKDRGSGGGPEGRSPEQGSPVSQSIGVQYNSMTGFMPYYRLELMGPLVRNGGLMLEGKLTNDFAVVGDMLNTSLTARYRISPLLSFSLEVPASAMYRFPTDTGASIAGTARLSLSNRPDQRDQSPGWVFGGELSTTATGNWTNASSLAAFATLTGSQPDAVLPYQASVLLGVGYRDTFLSPDLKLVATSDLTSLTLAEVKGTATLNFGLGARAPSLAVSAETSLFASQGDTKFQGTFIWDHISSGVSLGLSRVLAMPVLSYGISLGYRF